MIIEQQGSHEVDSSGNQENEVSADEISERHQSSNSDDERTDEEVGDGQSSVDGENHSESDVD